MQAPELTVQRKPVEIILGKSMPRSGHHLLARMIRGYFKEDLVYCESYSPPNCCRSIPCQKPQPPGCTNKYFMQKSHDFGMKDAILDGYKHIIQYRHPLPRAQSNFELALRNGTVEDNRISFESFLRSETNYYIRFFKKWIASPPPRALLLSYERLTANEAKSLDEVASFITGREADAGKVDMAVAHAGQVNPETRKPHRLRSIESHRYFDPATLASLEEKVFAACPDLDVARLSMIPE